MSEPSEKAKTLREFVLALAMFAASVSAAVLSSTLVTRIGWVVPSILWGLTAGGRLGMWIEACEEARAPERKAHEVDCALNINTRHGCTCGVEKTD